MTIQFYIPRWFLLALALGGNCYAGSITEQIKRWWQGPAEPRPSTSLPATPIPLLEPSMTPSFDRLSQSKTELESKREEIKVRTQQLVDAKQAIDAALPFLNSVAIRKEIENLKAILAPDPASLGASIQVLPQTGFNSVRNLFIEKRASISSTILLSVQLKQLSMEDANALYALLDQVIEQASQFSINHSVDAPINRPLFSQKVLQQMHSRFDRGRLSNAQEGRLRSILIRQGPIHEALIAYWNQLWCLNRIAKLEERIRILSTEMVQIRRTFGSCSELLTPGPALESGPKE